MDERDIERSAARIEQEREQSAKRTRAIVTRTGTADCIECGEPISAALLQEILQAIWVSFLSFKLLLNGLVTQTSCHSSHSFLAQMPAQ